MEKRNRYTAEFKAKVVLEFLQEEATLNQVASKYQLNPQMLSQWKSDPPSSIPPVSIPHRYDKSYLVGKYIFVPTYSFNSS